MRQWLVELNDEAQSKQDAWHEQLRRERAGLLCVHRVNFIDWNIRNEHNLYQPAPADVIAEMDGGDWDWWVTPERYKEMQGWGLDDYHMQKCKWCDSFHKPTKISGYVP